MSETPTPIIEIKNLHKIYDREPVSVKALRGINLKISSGEFIGILGPSGSGKSTLLHIIGALDLPTKGDLLIKGINTSNMTRNQLANLRQRIGFVFQNLNLVPNLTAIQNVELAITIQGKKRKKERKELAREMLSVVGLSDRENHENNELSGGQQQRVAIARALAQEPDFLLLDEPTGNVDTQTRDGLIRLIKNLNEEKGITIIIVSHDREVSSICERKLLLVDGKFVIDRKSGEKIE